MKRGLVFFVIVFCLIMVTNIYAEITGEAITGEAVTGKATNQPVGMNISIAVVLPSLTLITPKNHTYIYPEIILLNYSVTGTNQVWYNLDDTANISLTGNTQFSTNVGSHTLKLYANNSAGTVTQNITFLMDPSRLTILHSEYNGTTKGSSTNFSVNSYDDLENISEIILENDEFGKILFNEVINITEDEDPDDNLVDLDTHVNVSQNRIELNSTGLPNFNKTSTLYLYNLSFTNPRILRDGGVCGSSICVENSYSGGILSFNVTGFSVYSAEETPGVVTSPPVGGGSGGGGGGAAVDNFEVDVEEIMVSLKQGGTKRKEIVIKNIRNQKLNFILESPKLNEFLKISESEFELGAGESKKIFLDFIALEDSVPEMYLGELVIKAGLSEKRILIALEIESKRILFDVNLEIPRKFRKVLPGEEVFANIELFNLGEIKRGDVKLEYIIKNWKEEIIVFEEETVAVETRASLSKTFQLPDDIEYGDYVFYVRVVYDEEIASASAWFKVVSEEYLFRQMILLIIGGIVIFILVVLFIIFLIKRRKKTKKKRNGKRK